MINKINIAVDLDGVCCNFIKIFSEYCNKRFGDRCYIIDDVSVVKDWYWYKWYPMSEKEYYLVWDDIIGTKNFWTKLEVFNKSQWQYFLSEIDKYKNINTYFITNRKQTLGDTVAHQSADWLLNNGIKHPFVIETQMKEKFIDDLNIEFFIDDCADNIISVKKHAPSCKVYAQTAPYNEMLLLESGVEYIKTSGLRKFIDAVVEELHKKDYDSKWK